MDMKSHACRWGRLLAPVLTAILVAGIAISASANRECPELIGRWPHGPSMGVEASGNHAFVGSGTAVLAVEISTPSNPQVVGEVVLPGVVWGLAVAGDFLYAACAREGLFAIDVSDPANPVVVGSHDTPGVALDVTVFGDYAHVADGESGLSIIDVSDPTDPIGIGVLVTGGWAEGVTVHASGSHAYLADGDFLRAIDVSDPANPAQTWQYDTPGWAMGAAVAGGGLFVADGDSLLIFDLGDPAQPSPTPPWIVTPDSAIAVAVEGEIHAGDPVQVVRVVGVRLNVVPVERKEKGQEKEGGV